MRDQLQNQAQNSVKHENCAPLNVQSPKSSDIKTDVAVRVWSWISWNKGLVKSECMFLQMSLSMFKWVHVNLNEPLGGSNESYK